MADDGYGKYRRMLKMGVPRQQVNASMAMDGKDPSKFVEQDPSEAAPAGDADGLDLTLRNDGYDKYRKMLKCGLPMGAALQAMKKDGVDPKGLELGGGGGAAPAAPAAAPASEEAAGEGSGGDSGGGFLSELKARASNAAPGESASAPKKSAAPPKPAIAIPPPKAAAPIAIPPPKVAEQVKTPPIAIPPPKAATPIAIPPPKTEVRTPPIAIPPPKPVVEAPPPVVNAEPEEPAPQAEEQPKEPVAEKPVETVKPAPPVPIPIPSPKVATKPVAAPIAIPPPRASTSAISERSLEAVYDKVVEEQQTKQAEPVATVASSGAKPKWTPPQKQAGSGDDWKNLMANNRIKVPPAEPAASKPAAPEPSVEPIIKLDTAVTEQETITSPLVETKRAESPRISQQADRVPLIPIPPKSGPPGVAIKSTTPSLVAKPTTPTAAKPVSPRPLSTATQPVAARPAPPGVAQKFPVAASSSAPKPVAATNPTPSTSAGKPGGTLKKRHSNDWKAALAPYMASPSLTAAPATPAAAAAQSLPAPPPPVPSPSTPSTVNSSNPTGLRGNEKRLPAWAAVEKPAFLMNSYPDANFSESSKPANAPVNASSARPTPAPVNAANRPSPVVAKAPTTVSPPKPATVTPPKPVVTVSPPKQPSPSSAAAPAPTKPVVETSTQPPKVQPATGSIPKMFQRRFAWEQ